jgi:hypothetical protein
MLEVEVDDFGEGVDLGLFEVTDELCQTFFELRVCGLSVCIW